MKKVNFSLVIMAIAFLTSCGKPPSKTIIPAADNSMEKESNAKKPIPFTVSYFLKLTEVEKKLLQYYNSEEITITFEEKHTESSIEQGTLMALDSSKIETNKVLRLTPARAIGFSYDAKKRAICASFSKTNRIYRLWYMANKEGEFILDGGTGGTITRDGLKYKIKSAGEPNQNKLLFSLDRQWGQEKSSGTAEGDPVN